MRIKVKRFDKSLPLPARKTKQAACFDLTAREELVIQPKAVGYIPLNIACETPEGYFLLVAARSSTHKKGLMPVHGIGIGDPDFRGDQDEYHAPYFNFTDNPVTIERDERIAQGTFVKIEHHEWEEVEKLENENRGGFGTTGSK